MWTASLRYSGAGILLLGIAVALLMAWQSSHMLFAIVVGSIVVILTMLLLVRDGWRQTSPEVLTSRGFRPDRDPTVMDPGLRREYAAIIPAAVSRRITGNPTRRPAARSAARTRPARSGRTRRRNETLQPGATITLADERRAAHVDDLFIELDLELVGLVPVKKKVE
jgi:hypothetical protein